MLPQELRAFFWDADTSRLDINKDWFFIIERLIDYGDDKALSWLLNTYSHEQIKKVVSTSRRLKHKTAFFWKNYFRLKKEEVKCLHEPSPTNYWNY